jgi:hypothetical protein
VEPLHGGERETPICFPARPLDIGVWKCVGGKAPMAWSPHHWKPLLPSHLNIHTQVDPERRNSSYEHDHHIGWRTQIDVKRPILRSRTMWSYKKVRANQTKGSQFPRDRWRCLIVSRKRIIASRCIPGPAGCRSYPYSEIRKTGI